MEIFAIFILAIALVVLIAYCFKLQHQRYEIVEVNKERQQENQRIEQELQQRKTELNQHQEVIDNLINTESNLRERAQKLAQSVFADSMERLETQLGERQQAVQQYYLNINNSILEQIDAESQKLKDMEDKQLAYLQAQQRQAEIDNHKDYYRLVVSDQDLSDVQLLRNIQQGFFKKEAIDKLIWENYYKPAYDILMSHLFKEAGQVCGIYKITDLTTNLAYIGQSVNIKERLRQHIKSALAFGGATNKLYQTMQRSGPSNFTFEILEQVPRDKLNDREAYWISFYGTKEYGLNTTRGNNQ